MGWEEHFREGRAVVREVQGQNKIRVTGGNWEEFLCYGVVSAGWEGPGESAVNLICPFNTCSISEQDKMKPFYENPSSPTHKPTITDFQCAFISTSYSEKECRWWEREGT